MGSTRSTREEMWSA